MPRFTFDVACSGLVSVVWCRTEAHLEVPTRFSSFVRAGEKKAEYVFEPRIMIVEENLVDASGHRERLEALGYEVVTDSSYMTKVSGLRQDLGADEPMIQIQRLATVGLISASLAHDFNNLITALGANLYAVGDAVGAALPLSECMAILDRCASLTKRMLAFSLPSDAVQRESEVGPVDLRECLAEALTIVHKLLPSKIKLVSDLGTESAFVRADSNLVVHAVINLVLNARDALPDGGTIDATIAAAPAGRHQLTVADSGVGMSPETLRRAFEPFFTTKSLKRGTGLGLANVRQMTEAASGTVSIASELGAGTRVTLTFPDVSLTSSV
ncbi:MAG: HAMP domain-containing sensor histidine kinase [Deltaproteobacteria bacterium]